MLLHQKLKLVLLCKYRAHVNKGACHVSYLSVLVSCTFQLFFNPHSLFSAFILLLSSSPMLSLCSVYSCLMSSLAASIFRGFLEAWTLRTGRTARLCWTISEVSLRRRQRWGINRELMKVSHWWLSQGCYFKVDLWQWAYFGIWGPKMASKSLSISILLVVMGSSSTWR